MYVVANLKRDRLVISHRAGWISQHVFHRDPEAFQPESAILAHSHLLVQHLLKQLEHHQRDRHDRQRRPEWLTVLIHQTAALFTPLTGVGRVGSQCEYTNDGWEARLYLGSTEIVGGKDDGHSQLLGFELDLSRLTESFTKVDEFQWYVGASAEGSNSSFMSVTGSVDDNKICLKVYSRPPKEAGPAFRQHADGSLDPVC